MENVAAAGSSQSNISRLYGTQKARPKSNSTFRQLKTDTVRKVKKLSAKTTKKAKRQCSCDFLLTQQRHKKQNFAFSKKEARY